MDENITNDVELEDGESPSEDKEWQEDNEIDWDEGIDLAKGTEWEEGSD